MKSHKFTARQQAAILRLYVQQQLSTAETAKRLRLTVSPVLRFLHKHGVMRRQGSPPGTRGKLSLADRQSLEGELATTMDAVLARKYGLSNERIRQIRQQLGYPSSQILRNAWAAPARAKRREQEKLALKLRQQQRRAKRLLAVNRLSKRWKAGLPLAKLAQEYVCKRGSMNSHVYDVRKEFPEKFPYRHQLRSPRHLEEVR
jgi:hypothetical protein